MHIKTAYPNVVLQCLACNLDINQALCPHCNQWVELQHLRALHTCQICEGEFYFPRRLIDGVRVPQNTFDPNQV